MVFGDSVAWGGWDKKGGWVTRLIQDVNPKVIKTNKKYYCAIYNLGVSGDTTLALLKGFEKEVRVRIDEPEDIIVVFAVGLNDSQFLNDKKRLRVPEKKFEESLQKLIDKAKKYASDIVLVGPNPVDDKKVDPIPWAPDKSYKNKYVEKYNMIIEKVAKKNSLAFIDIFNQMKKINYKKLLYDGAHPNSSGHKFIHEKVKAVLSKKNKI